MGLRSCLKWPWDMCLSLCVSISLSINSIEITDTLQSATGKYTVVTNLASMFHLMPVSRDIQLQLAFLSEGTQCISTQLLTYSKKTSLGISHLNSFPSTYKV